MKLAKLICVCALVVSSAAQARPLTKGEKREDFKTLGALIKSSYGPLEYKQTRFGLDVDLLVEHYATLAEGVSNLEFYHLINKFVAEFKDSHFRSGVQTNFISTLGFIGDRIEGKILIDFIFPQLLPKTRFPFERGDEILEIDGVPASDLVAELAKYKGMGNEESALRTAANLVGYRPASLVPPARGLAIVKIRRGTSSIEETIALPWHEAGELMEDPQGSTWTPVVRDYAELSIEGVFADLPKAEQAFRCSGSTRTAIPKNATILMMEPFVAYYHPTPKGNVGYLRIPHYSWDTQAELRFQQYEYIVDKMEKETVGLIIDQDHNCGGSVFFLEQMVSLFADKPFKGLEFRFMASRAEYLDFEKWVQGEAKFTVEGQDWLGVLKLVKQAWQSRSRMTERTTFHNNRLLAPNAIRYTKPIVMLIDEMSGSGGDAFPALMQGLGRAKLMGTRTMGAGGHVVATPDLFWSANKLNITKSLFYRMDGKEVENNGAEPDIAYTPTRDDFLYEYRSYQKRYLEELAKLIP